MQCKYISGVHSPLFLWTPQKAVDSTSSRWQDCVQNARGFKWRKNCVNVALHLGTLHIYLELSSRNYPK